MTVNKIGMTTNFVYQLKSLGIKGSAKVMLDEVRDVLTGKREAKIISNTFEKIHEDGYHFSVGKGCYVVYFYKEDEKPVFYNLVRVKSNGVSIPIVVSDL